MLIFTKKENIIASSYFTICFERVMLVKNKGEKNKSWAMLSYQIDHL